MSCCYHTTTRFARSRSPRTGTRARASSPGLGGGAVVAACVETKVQAPYAIDATMIQLLRLIDNLTNVISTQVSTSRGTCAPGRDSSAPSPWSSSAHRASASRGCGCRACRSTTRDPQVARTSGSSHILKNLRVSRRRRPDTYQTKNSSTSAGPRREWARRCDLTRSCRARRRLRRCRLDRAAARCRSRRLSVARFVYCNSALAARRYIC